MNFKCTLSAVCVALLVVLVESEKQSARLPILEKEHGQTLKMCKKEWTAVSKDPQRLTDCMSKLLFSLADRMDDPNGIPVLQLPQFEPLYIPFQSLADSDALQGNLTDARVYNLSTGFNPRDTKMTYNPVTKIVTMKTFYKEIVVTTKYSVSLNFGSFFSNVAPVAGSGSGTAGFGVTNATDVTNTVHIHMREGKNGRLSVSKAESSLVLTRVQNVFKPFKKDDPLGPLMQTVFGTGDSAVVLMMESMPATDKVIARGLGNIFYLGWKHLEEL